MNITPAKMMEDMLAPIVRYVRTSSNIVQTSQEDFSPAPILGSYEAHDGSKVLWVFRGYSAEGVPFANVEGTGMCSITFEQSGYWSPRHRSTHLQYPQISVYYHCDSTRGAINAPLLYDGRDKALTLHNEVSKLLHIRDKGTGGFLEVGATEDRPPLRIVSSMESMGLRVYPVPGGDSMVIGEARFDMEVLQT